jgi:hypothetical protein
MILNNSNYNPLPEILKFHSRLLDNPFTFKDVDYIRKELFKGGVIPENDDELEIVFKLLIEMSIL